VSFNAILYILLSFNAILSIFYCLFISFSFYWLSFYLILLGTKLYPHIVKLVRTVTTYTDGGYFAVMWYDTTETLDDSGASDGTFKLLNPFTTPDNFASGVYVCIYIYVCVCVVLNPLPLYCYTEKKLCIYTHIHTNPNPQYHT
jgi:hypothetical protein